MSCFSRRREAGHGDWIQGRGGLWRRRSHNRLDNSVDLLKFAACVLIVGSHCLPLFYDGGLDYYYGQWLFRFCVPLFLVSSGYFFGRMSIARRVGYAKRILALYAISMAVYLPLVIRSSVGFNDLVRSILFGWSHLWYLVALALALILCILLRRLLERHAAPVMVALLFVGILFDEWYKVLNSETLGNIARTLEYAGGARGAFSFALPLVLLGMLIARYANYAKYSVGGLAFVGIVLFAAGFLEATILRMLLGDGITSDLTVFGWTPAIPIFLLGLRVPSPFSASFSRTIRKLCDVVYIMHVWVIQILRLVFGVVGLPLFAWTLIASFVLAALLLRLLQISGGASVLKSAA